VQSPSASLAEAALERLDHLIAEVTHSQDSQTDLLLEHLRSARVCLLGAMPKEYRFSLMEARQLAPQKTIMQEIGSLLDQTPPGCHPQR